MAGVRENAAENANTRFNHRDTEGTEKPYIFNRSPKGGFAQMQRAQRNIGIPIAKNAKKYRERRERFNIDTSRHHNTTVNIG